MIKSGTFGARAHRSWRAILLAAWLAGGAAAQEAEPPVDEVDSGAGAIPTEAPAGVEVIRVKGRAVTAIEADVPSSVTQFDAAAIEALGAQNISDLAKVTPNVEIRTAGATASTFFIRGVGLSDLSANSAGAVAIFQDDVALNAPALQLGQLFDIENVEVLRGPQATGPNRNASAGSFRIYSHKPRGEREAKLRTSVGNFGALEFEGHLETPVLDEVLAARFSFRYRQRDGYADNRCADAPANPAPRTPHCDERVFDTVNPANATSNIAPGLPHKVEDRGQWAARGQFRFQPPGTEMDWLLNVHGSRLDQLSTLGQSVPSVRVADVKFKYTRSRGGSSPTGFYRDPDITAIYDSLFAQGFDNETVEALAGREVAANLDSRPWDGDYNRVGDTTLDTLGAFLRGEFSLGEVDIVSLSSADGYERFRDSDSDFTPDVLFESITEDESLQLYQWVEASGALAETAVNWNLGGFYLYEDLSVDVDRDVLIANNVEPFDRELQQEIHSYGVYAGGTWDFLDDFTLEAGARYNWETKKYDFTLFPRSGPSNFSGELDGDEPTATISLLWRPTEESQVYWKYSRGWKAGHINADSSLALLDRDGVVPAEPETIDAFETGLRTRYFDGRVGLGANLFYYKYKDYQVFFTSSDNFAPPARRIINADDAEVYGGEADIRLEPFDGFELTARGSWLESRYLAFTNTIFQRGQSGLQAFVIPVEVDYTGNQLINSPRFKLNLALNWAIDLGRFGTVTPRWDATWSDDIFFDATEGRGQPDFTGLSNLPEHAVGQRSNWQHNARLSYKTPDRNIELAGWVRNVGNKAYRTYAFDASEFSQVVINYIGEPRTFGLDISFTF
jgi:iron complex outermembrane receptor protein